MGKLMVMGRHQDGWGMDAVDMVAAFAINCWVLSGRLWGAGCTSAGE